MGSGANLHEMPSRDKLGTLSGSIFPAKLG
jgi:hypothetical protein